MTQKATQAEVNYGRGDPINNCGLCTYYQGMQRCKIVMGAITPVGVCSEWKAVPNPFGKTLSGNEIKAIKAMAADSVDRSQQAQQAPQQQAPMQPQGPPMQ